MASPAALAAQWDARVSTIARNLTDFSDSDAARLVRARVGNYTGRTREAALEVEAAIKALQDNYLVLSGVVNDAMRASRKPSLLTNRDAEVLGLLEGPSVRLRTLTIPVSQRGLLDAPESQDRVTPGTVLDAMQRTFTRVRDTVTAIATAEDALAGRVAVLQARIAALRGWQTATHVDVGVGSIAMAEIQGVDRDPLDAVAWIDAVEAELQVAEAARAKADVVLATLRERLAAAARGLDVLRETYRAFGPARDALAGIAVEPPRAARDETQDLADWLASLRRVLARGDLNPIGIGLDRWEAALAAARASAEAALGAARAPLAELEDLRGVLSALRVKGAALGGIAGDAERAAKAAVRAERVDLAQARACVKAYELALASAGTRKVG